VAAAIDDADADLKPSDRQCSIAVCAMTSAISYDTSRTMTTPCAPAGEPIAVSAAARAIDLSFIASSRLFLSFRS